MIRMIFLKIKKKKKERRNPDDVCFYTLCGSSDKVLLIDAIMKLLSVKS